MFIVLHCGGLPFNGDTIAKRSLGGSETAGYYVAKALADLGHQVTMFTNEINDGIFDGVRYVYAGPRTDKAPLGESFTYYAENTPHDVLIIQRSPSAFSNKFASKINLWWTHDLGLYKMLPAVSSMMWNVDGILCVSEYHKEQISKVYAFTDDIVKPITNAIDPELYQAERYTYDIFNKFSSTKDGDPIDDMYGHGKKFSEQTKLIYSSRPERGLEHLVKPDGIMEQLLKAGTNHHLYVCGYDNPVAEMEEFYGYLKACCEYLDNVTYLGALTKQELADVQRQCDVWVYPTEFEEVSCITAMEAMAAGLYILASDHAALTETITNAKYKANLIPLVDGMADKGAFVKALKNIKMKRKNQTFHYVWKEVAMDIMDIVGDIFSKTSDNAKAKELMRTSDIYALEKHLSACNEDDITDQISKEYLSCYRFAYENTWEKHYADYYQYETDKGAIYGPQDMSNDTRYEPVAANLDSLCPSSGIVIDYGCAHGHYTINLAKLFPQRTFIGIDITRSNIDIARKWAKDEGVSNVSFIHGCVEGDEIKIINSEDGQTIPLVDYILAAEVMEHVGDPSNLITTLCNSLKLGGSICLTTPYGGWEAIGFKKEYPWRAHVHHFERQDLHDMFGHHDQFSVIVIPSGVDDSKDIVGSYLTAFKPSEGVTICNAIDYERKLSQMNPRQTVSLCMIVHNGEETLLRALNSVQNVVDEICIAIDETTTDGTEAIINRFIEKHPTTPSVKKIFIKSPLEIGFDVARNLSIGMASGDWILWMDTDEIMETPVALLYYARNNQYNGCMISQHHLTVEPAGLLKTDHPTRFFRNNIGIKFFGVVHEHPELVMNEGFGRACQMDAVSIAHYGYATEVIRRERFQRNIDLMFRDREKNPNRLLGKFLWVRDLSQMIRYELETNGNKVTDGMMEMAKEGIDIWVGLLEKDSVRLAVEGLEFYEVLARIQTRQGFQCTFDFDASIYDLHQGQGYHVNTYFVNKDHAKKLMALLIDVKVEDHDWRYVA